MLHEALVAAETSAHRAARGCRSSTCRGSTASTRTGWPRRWRRTRTSSCSRITRRSVGSATRSSASSSGRAARRPRRCRLRRRGLARLRHAARGASLPPARRCLARRADRGAPARPGRRRERAPGRVWLVLPEPLSTRIFFDCGIVDGLLERLGRRCGSYRSSPPTQAGEWVGARDGVDVAYRDELLPASGRASRRSCGGTTAGSTAGRLLPARDPAQPPARLPPRAHAARPQELRSRSRPRGPAAKAAAGSSERDVALALRPRRWVPGALARADAARLLGARRLQPADRSLSCRFSLAARRLGLRSSVTSRAGTTPSARA